MLCKLHASEPLVPLVSFSSVYLAGERRIRPCVEEDPATHRRNNNSFVMVANDSLFRVMSILSWPTHALPLVLPTADTSKFKCAFTGHHRWGLNADDWESGRWSALTVLRCSRYKVCCDPSDPIHPLLERFTKETGHEVWRDTEEEVMIPLWRVSFIVGTVHLKKLYPDSLFAEDMVTIITFPTSMPLKLMRPPRASC